jgi:hypothetical protein
MMFRATMLISYLFGSLKCGGERGSFLRKFEFCHFPWLIALAQFSWYLIFLGTTGQLIPSIGGVERIRAFVMQRIYCVAGVGSTTIEQEPVNVALLCEDVPHEYRLRKAQDICLPD